MKSLQLEIGKSYRNRTGEIIKIISQDDDILYPFDSKHHCYCKN
jgi:hypothetical protein